MPSKSAAQHRLMEAISETDKAYLAGFFDGEGTVAVYESFAPSKHGKRPIWIFQAQITNTSLYSLERVVTLVGGTVVRKSKGKANWRQGYVWRVCGERALVFMKIIRPYAVIKAAELDEAIRFRSLKRDRGEFQSVQQIAEKRAIVLNLKELKRA